MRWKNIDQAFPSGEVPGKDITVRELRNTDQPLVIDTFERAREMATKKSTHIYGPNGEYAQIIDYDALDTPNHNNDRLTALNVYGHRMIKNCLENIKEP